jgi:uncharacterized membrane-anchored protein
MADPADLLELPSKRSRLHALAGIGVLERGQLRAALAALGLRPSRASWAAYLYWHALILGVALLVAGMIFFVAANWSALPGYVRMAMVGAAMIAATLAGGWLGHSLAGRSLSLLGGLLFGPLLAVYGQVYQTGADAWQLFASWAAVLLAYAVTVRFAGTWVVALICVHVAWLTWIDQELGGTLYEGRNAWIVASLALVDAAIVIAAERIPGLRAREREVLAVTAAGFGLALLLPFGIMTVVDELPPGGLLGLVSLGLGLAGIWWAYRWRRPRLAMLVALATTVTILATCVAVRLLVIELRAELFGIAMVGALVCAMVWALTRWLLRWRQEQPEPEPEPDSSESGPRRGDPRRPSMTLAAVFERVSPGARPDPRDPRLAAALHDGDGSDAALLVRAFTAIGTWIGAAMVALIVAALNLYEFVPFALLLGLGLFVGAALLSRRPGRSLAMTQVIWAMTLGAHGLWLGALAGEVELDATTITALWTLLNVALVLIIRVPSLQLASAVCAVGFATGLAGALDLPMFPVWVAVPTAALATAAWVYEASWASRLGRSWSAIAYGLPLGLIGPLILLSLPEADGGGGGGLVATVAMVGLIAAVLAQAQHELRVELRESIASRTHVIGVMILLAALAGRQVPGLSLALVWLLLAHLRRSPSLQILALVQLGGFLLLFYYQLDTSLLHKALWVASTGAVVLLGALLGRLRPTPSESRPRPAPRRSRWLPALALSLLTTGLIVGASAHNQWILAHGRPVLLELAPVDPRSLMQGDYMILRYELEQQLDLELDQPTELPRHGRLVLRLDEHGVGQFVRVDDDSPLTPDQLRLEYRLRDGWAGRLRIGAESFLFEEGRADEFAEARYAELIVADTGKAILVGLRDVNRQAID